MTQSTDSDSRPATSPLSGVVRTSLGAATVATVLVAGLGVANPVLGLALLAAGTGALSGAGKVARDYLAQPRRRSGVVAGFWTILAHTFSWLG